MTVEGPVGIFYINKLFQHRSLFRPYTPSLIGTMIDRQMVLLKYTCSEDNFLNSYDKTHCSAIAQTFLL